MAMAARKTEPDESAGREDLIPFTMRMPKGLIEDLDAWVNELNRGRRVGKVTRSDVIRVLLERGVVVQPSLDEPGAAKKPMAVIHDTEGREREAKPLPEPIPTTIDVVGADGLPKQAHLTHAHYQIPASDSAAYPLEPLRDPKGVRIDPYLSLAAGKYDDAPILMLNAALYIFKARYAPGLFPTTRTLAGILLEGQSLEEPTLMNPSCGYVAVGLGSENPVKLELLSYKEHRALVESNVGNVAIIGDKNNHFKIPGTERVPAIFRVTAKGDGPVVATLYEYHPMLERELGPSDDEPIEDPARPGR